MNQTTTTAHLWRRLARPLLAGAALLGSALTINAQTLVWEENFDGNAINPETWTFDFGDGCERGVCGWGNQELQYYTSRSENARVENGSLVIEARKEKFQTKEFTSARLKTFGRVQFKYGTLEARIKVPNLKNGLWPAFWLLGTTGTWPASGEIDIMEMGAQASYPNNVNNWMSGAVHWSYKGTQADYGQTYKGTADLTDDYHVYKMVWDAQAIKMYIDGTQYFVVDISKATENDMEEFHKQQYILLNLAVGGNYTGIPSVGGITAPLPAKMMVDYLKLYQNPSDELYLAKEHAYAGEFGIYTEKASITDKLKFGEGAELYYWNNLVNLDPAPTAYEGSEVLAVRAASGSWFGMGVDHAPLNMLNFAENGALKFQFKSSYKGQFKIGVKSGHGESWINFPANGAAQYGLVRDGAWHEVTIPLSAFDQPNVGMHIDLGSMTSLFMFAGDPATSNADFYFDDMRLSGGVAANPSPTVSITAPTADAIVTTPASVTITAAAADENGSVAKVEFYQGTTKLGEDTSAPYSFTWTGATAGVYTLTAKATDNEGAVTTSKPVTVFVAAPNNAAPTVTLTTDKTSYLTPASITLTATAADTDGSIYKVDFYQGTTLLATDMTSPYTYTWSGAATGTYSLTAKATDNGGAVKTSTAVSITVADPVKPTVTLTSPVATDKFTAPTTITLTATAADANGTVSKVEFYNGDTKLGEDTSAPYSFEWKNVAAGSYSITARATDNDGYTTTSAAVAVAVKAVACTGTAASGDYSYEVFSQGGSVTYTFHPLGATAGGNLALIYIQEGGVGGYPGYPMTKNDADDFTFTRPIADGVATSFYFTYQVGAGGPEKNTAATPHTYTVGQNCGTATNAAPSVSITAPAASVSYTAPATITITADAADTDGTVSKVEFFQGTTKLGEDTSAPYSYEWTSVAAGTYSLTTKATDNAGATTTSAAVSVTVAGSSTGTEGYCFTTEDYSFKAETMGENVTFTFHPLGATAGGTLALIYIREGAEGAYPGYPMTKNDAGDFTFTKAIASGTVTSVYFTYQVGAGGPEKNTAATPHSYTVGTSCATTTASKQPSSLTSVAVFPNPSAGRTGISFTTTKATGYTAELYDLKGTRLRTIGAGRAAGNQPVALELNAMELANGVYLIRVITDKEAVAKRLVISR
ncbi:Ig-like domain-containing protein [Hymenobacter guriensis]|uniref:Family 16 glycosylhydrolase n=1 Tax=Hymenobacter guriensis TaxID=2793065 RepID=A0ABS0KXB2_9BACT|nr:Ig-like domain-containing protein [Hymenobacter guriensis]MBG8552491.1 family 16 glycosylhydrolase [Hymenobacter guriensis]